MAWYALYKWYKPWSKRGYPRMNIWYSQTIDPEKWAREDMKKEIEAKNAMARLLIMHQLLALSTHSPYNR